MGGGARVTPPPPKLAHGLNTTFFSPGPTFPWRRGVVGSATGAAWFLDVLGLTCVGHHVAIPRNVGLRLLVFSHEYTTP